MQCVWVDGRTDRCRDTDVSFSVLSVSPLGLPDLGGKPFSACKCTCGALYQALYKALNEVLRCSTAWLLACLDEPEPFVDASGDLGEDGSGIGVLQFGCLLAGVAYVSSELGERRRKRIDVAVPINRRRPVPVERRTPDDRVRRSLSRAAKLHNVLGNQARILLHPLDKLVEQLAQGPEIGAFDAP